jgi:hypothetical protein
VQHEFLHEFWLRALDAIQYDDDRVAGVVATEEDDVAFGHPFVASS